MDRWIGWVMPEESITTPLPSSPSLAGPFVLLHPLDLDCGLAALPGLHTKQHAQDKVRLLWQSLHRAVYQSWLASWGRSMMKQMRMVLPNRSVQDNSNNKKGSHDFQKSQSKFHRWKLRKAQRKKNRKDIKRIGWAKHLFCSNKMIVAHPMNSLPAVMPSPVKK